MRASSIAVACVACALLGCDVANISENHKESSQAQKLPITLGGFVENHPERGELGGTCTPDGNRDILNCDVYNGLMDWVLTEITIAVTWSPYGDDDKRYYREAVSIAPLQTRQVSIRLGLQLPSDDVYRFRGRPPIATSHWEWLFAGARGSPVSVNANR